MIRLGTRGSRLALIQVEMVRPALESFGYMIEPVIIRTSGDKGDREKLGAFVGELQQAVLAGEVDVALHCLKDLPTVGIDGLTLAAYLPRGDHRDAILTRDGDWHSLPSGAHIGTGSLRRTSQLRQLRPDFRFSPLAGNVDTRLRRLSDGEYDAIVLAMAGLDRLGVTETVRYERFRAKDMMPAPGQGVLVLETRDESAALVKSLDHLPTRRAAEAERAFLAMFGTGCRLPIGAFAQVRGDAIRFAGKVTAPDGSDFRSILTRGVDASVGVAAAQELIEDGALELLPG